MKLLICESNKDRRPLQYCTCIYRVQKRQARNYSFSYLAKNLLLISPSCKLDEVLRYWRKEENFSEILFVPTLVLKCRPTCWILFQGGIYIKTLCRLKRTGLYQFQTSKQTIKNITKKILFPTTKLSYNIVAESIVISMYYWNLAAILYLFIYGKKIIFFRLPIGRNIFLYMYIFRYKEIFKVNICKSVYNMDTLHNPNMKRTTTKRCHN